MSRRPARPRPAPPRAPSRPARPAGDPAGGRHSVTDEQSRFGSARFEYYICGVGAVRLAGALAIQLPPGPKGPGPQGSPTPPRPILASVASP